MKPIIKRILAAAFPVLVLSCSGLFTNSLASWAKRDPDKLMPEATPENAWDLVTMAANDPDLSLALLNKIAGSDKKLDPAMQAAALRAAVNAADMTNALLSSIHNLDADMALDAPNFVAAALANTGNLAAAAGAIMRIFPSGAVITTSPPVGLGYGNSQDYFDQFPAADVAGAAIVLFAAQFQASGTDIATFVGGASGDWFDYGGHLAKSVIERPSGALPDFVKTLFDLP